jgi:PBP1b-binding outer membrane lipoprotein LpoB
MFSFDIINITKDKMKKVISVLILFFAFTLSAQAQEAKQQVKKSPEELAKQDVFEITKAVDTNGNDQFFVDLNNLFIKKHTMLQAATSADEKEKISQIIDAKLKATLTPDQLRILSSTDLYHRLIH